MAVCGEIRHDDIMQSLLFISGPWCFGYHSNGNTYQGNVNVTTIGKPCQRWEAPKPHVHKVLAGYIPDESLEDAANYFVTLVVMANGHGVIQQPPPDGGTALYKTLFIVSIR